MDTSEILSSLREQLNRINAALAALEGSVAEEKSATNGRRRGRRRMSAASRRRISEAMAKRWAQRKTGR